jgi:hypothetical protein
MGPARSDELKRLRQLHEVVPRLLRLLRRRLGWKPNGKQPKTNGKRAELHRTLQHENGTKRDSILRRLWLFSAASWIELHGIDVILGSSRP